MNFFILSKVGLYFIYLLLLLNSHRILQIPISLYKPYVNLDSSFLLKLTIIEHHKK